MSTTESSTPQPSRPSPEELFKQYKDLARHVATHYAAVTNFSLFDDMHQECLITLWQCSLAYDPAAHPDVPFWGFLLKKLKFTCLGLLEQHSVDERRLQSWNEVLFSDEDDGDVTRGDLAEFKLAQDEANRLISAGREEARRLEVREALRTRLTADQRKVVNMILREGINPAEACERLGLTRHQQHRLLHDLRQRLSNLAPTLSAEEWRESRSRRGGKAATRHKDADGKSSPARRAGRKGAAALHAKHPDLAAKSLAQALHVRWHVRRGIIKPGCPQCTAVP